MLLVPVAAVALFGCEATMQMSLLPKLSPDIQPSRLHLMRPHVLLLGEGEALSLFLNGQVIIQLSAGDWTTFAVAPGRQMLAVKGGFG